MRLNSKGQVTIPADLRRRHNLREGDVVEVVEDGETLRIVRPGGAETAGTKLVHRLRGAAGPGPSTDELMRLLRGE